MRYRKKPVVIEAYQFENKSGTTLPRWVENARESGQLLFQSYPKPHLMVKTLEGTMTANLGDWIIKGVQGEIYPCKPDIFAATYEEVQDD